MSTTLGSIIKFISKRSLSTTIATTYHSSARWWTTKSNKSNSQMCRPRDAASYRSTNRNSRTNTWTIFSEITAGIITSEFFSPHPNSWISLSIKGRKKITHWGSSNWRDWTVLAKGPWLWVSYLSNIRISFDITIFTYLNFIINILFSTLLLLTLTLTLLLLLLANYLLFIIY